MRVGVLVLGFARPVLLAAVLESLRRQQVLGCTHVWLDGMSGRPDPELGTRVDACRKACGGYEVAELRAHNGHLGIEKLMLDALGSLTGQYDALVVLEDDCFPTRNAIAEFAVQLEAVLSEENVFSVYGHHFLVPQEGQSIGRFQGWGWAALSERLTPVIRQVRECFLMTEAEYLTWVHAQLSPLVRERLDVTPGRNVLSVLERFFSWDSCVALVTAVEGRVHRKTPRRVIYNCGLGPDSGHFQDTRGLDMPPYNLIRPEKIWSVF